MGDNGNAGVGIVECFDLFCSKDLGKLPPKKPYNDHFVVTLKSIRRHHIKKILCISLHIHYILFVFPPILLTDIVFIDLIHTEPLKQFLNNID
jgi:hypothetical protein